MYSTRLPVSMYTTRTSIDMCRFNVRSSVLKNLEFSVKDRYQLSYFVCIKDLNTETITSLKLNLFSFSICCCQHHEAKTICLYIFLISGRYWGIYSAVSLVSTYHNYLWSTAPTTMICWRCHSNSVNTGSRLPSISDLKTRRKRNVVGIDMIRNNVLCLYNISINQWLVTWSKYGWTRYYQGTKKNYLTELWLDTMNPQTARITSSSILIILINIFYMI